MKPLVQLDSRETPEGTLALSRRGERDYLITIAGRVLMTSSAHRSEAVLGAEGCAPVASRPAPRVLIGGLGMGFTLRAALDALPPAAQVVVAELNPITVEWCRGPLAPLTGGAVLDPRVTVEIVDVAQAIARAANHGPKLDAILIDLYVGPSADTAHDDALYGNRATGNAHKALTPGGIYAVWGEGFDPTYEKRLIGAGFKAKHDRPGKGGYRHVVYFAQRP